MERNLIMKTRIILAGGSGFLGGALAKHFYARGNEVIVLARRARVRTDGVREVAWDARALGNWEQFVDGADVVINLAGKSVDCRYNAKNRREIIASRVDSTRAIGEAIARAKSPPRVWLNSSSATIYQHTFGTPMDEQSATGATAGAHDDFSIEVIEAWERALFSAELGVRNAESSARTRKVALRITLVLGTDGGVYPVLRRLTKFGLGGRMGSGRQFVSWIHIADFLRAVDWLIEHEEISGAVNLAAPNPLPNAAMMELFREVCVMPLGLPATEWMLEVGAFFLRTETELILKSRRVVPGRLLAGGFEFQFPELRTALADLEKPK
ncbi:MAG: hypothetical protein RLZZ350_627 [Verrucomicrobiota bacterium]|jgi:uncharacterized protein (TIGR01777 family)